MQDVIGARRSLDAADTRARVGLTAAAAAGLLICSGGPSMYVSIHYVENGAGWRSWMHVYPFTAVAVFGVVVLVLALRAVPRTAWPWPMYVVAAYAAWALVSVQWTVSPDATPHVAITQVGILAFGCWFGWRLRPSEQLAAVVAMTTVAGVASALVARYQPRYNLMFETLGAWQGIFGNRNSLSPICVLGLLSLAGWLAVRPTIRRTVFVLPMAWIHVDLLRHSGGATSSIALALIGVMCVLLLIAWLLKRVGVPGPVVGGAALAALGVASWWTFTHIDDLAVRVGRDPTLSGRREIWADVRGLIADGSWHGYGYWAFWDRPDLTEATYRELGPYASAHNSWLEVLLGLGIVGLVLFLVITITALACAFTAFWRRPAPTTAWWCGVVVFVLVHNMMESFVLWHSAILVLLVASTCTVAWQPTTGSSDVDVEEAATSTAEPIPTLDASPPTDESDGETAEIEMTPVVVRGG